MAGIRSGCSMCGEEFAGISNFDAHLIEDYSNDDRSKWITCVPPASIGLKLNEFGHWANPDGVVIDKPVRQAHRQVLVCAKCGKIWERKPQKGRKPKFCKKCS